MSLKPITSLDRKEDCPVGACTWLPSFAFRKPNKAEHSAGMIGKLEAATCHWQSGVDYARKAEKSPAGEQTGCGRWGTMGSMG